MPTLVPNNQKPVHAVFATSYLPYVGGAQIAIREIARRNDHSEFYIFCCRLSRKLPVHEDDGNIHVVRVGFGIWLDRFILPIAGPFLALYSVRVTGAIWGMMAQYGGMAALIYHILTRKRHKFILTLQEGGDPREMERKAGMLLPMMRLVVRSCTTLQVISTALLEWASELGFRGNDYHIIPNGVDVERFAAKPPQEELQALRNQYGANADTRIVFSASRLSPKNGMLHLTEATALLPDNYITVIAGDGRLSGIIKNRIRELGLQNRVFMLGDRPLEDVIRYLHISHVFVRPSISEGLGNAFLEAMAAGVPVVGTPVGGIKDFLIDGKNGIAVQPKNPESIAEGILRYQDPKTYECIVANGREMVLEKYTWSHVAATFKGIL